MLGWKIPTRSSKRRLSYFLKLSFRKIGGFDNSDCDESTGQRGEKLRPLHHYDERSGELDEKVSNGEKKNKFGE